MIKKSLGLEMIKQLPKMPQMSSCLRNPPDAQYLYFKGNHVHYNHLQQNYKQYSHQKYLYCLDKSKLDIAYHMVKNKIMSLTYITSRHYQTVFATDNSSLNHINRDNSSLNHINNQQQITKQSGAKYFDGQLSEFLRKKTFIIKNSFLDCHPFESYYKICGYLMLKHDAQIMDIFESFSISNYELKKSFLLVPLMSELRQRYLLTQKSKSISSKKRTLKLQNLNRIRNKLPSEIEIHEAMTQYRYLTQLKSVMENIQPHSSKDIEQFKILWAIQNNYGEYAKISELIEGKFKNYSYGRLE